MGITAALELYKSVENLTQILAIEYLLAAQAFEFFKDQRFGEGTSQAWRFLRAHVPSYVADRFLAPHTHQVAELLRAAEGDDGKLGEWLGVP